MTSHRQQKSPPNIQPAVHFSLQTWCEIGKVVYSCKLWRYRCIVEHVGLTYLTSLLTWYISCCSASVSDVGPAVTSWTRSQLDRLNVSRGAIKRAVMSRLIAETRFRDWGGGCFGPDLNTAALTFNHIPATWQNDITCAGRDVSSIFKNVNGKQSTCLYPFSI